MLRSSLLPKTVQNECVASSSHMQSYCLLLAGQDSSQRPRICLSRTLYADYLLKCCIFNSASPTILFLVLLVLSRMWLFVFYLKHKSWLQKTGDKFMHQILYPGLKKKPLRESKSPKNILREIILIFRFKTFRKYKHLKFHMQCSSAQEKKSHGRHLSPTRPTRRW